MLAEARDYNESFRKLVPFNRLGRAQQDQLFSETEVLQLAAGSVLFRQGSQDGQTYYLLDGKLNLLADDARVKQITSGTDAGLHPIGHLQPRRLSAVAETPSCVLKVKSAVIEKMLAMRTPGGTTADHVGAESMESLNPGWLAAALKPELFAKLPPTSLPRIFASLERVRFKSGENVIRQGDIGDYYYIIKEGSCEVRRTTSVSAHGIKLAELKPGDAFGEDALISNMRRNATVRMITDGELMRIGKDDFVEYIKKPMLKLVSFDEAAALVSKGAMWLDVRFPEECRNGTLPGSMNIPLNMLRIYTSKLDTSRSYVAYCDDGSRSSVAAFILREHGFDAYCVDGGCGAQLAALYAIHGPSHANPDLTQTVIPRSTLEPTVQDTVPLAGEETQAMQDQLATIQALGPAEKPLILDHPVTPIIDADAEATTLAMPILHEADGHVAFGEPAKRPKSTTVVDFHSRLDDYDAKLRDAAERMQSQDTALHAVESRLRETEVLLAKERETGERLKEALLEAEKRLAEHANTLQQSANQLREYETAVQQNNEAVSERSRLEEAQRQRLEELEKLVVEQAKSLEQSAEQLQQYENAIQEGRTAASEREQLVLSLHQKVEELERRLADQAVTLQLSTEQLRRYEQEAKQETATVAGLEQQIQAYRERVETLERQLAEQSSALERSTDQLRQYETALQQSSVVCAERDRLEQSYRQRIEELEKLLAVQSETEELLSSERQKLIGELAEQRRLLEEARRQLKEAPAQEQQLQQATHAQLAELRKILGAEFARNAALVELARQERQSAEAARQRLVEQTEAVLAEYRGRNQKIRAQEEARMREERRLLEMERDFLRSATEAANQAREEAEAMLRKAQEQAARLRALTHSQLDALEAEAVADMKRVRSSLAWTGPEAGSNGVDVDSHGEQVIEQEIAHRVDDMLMRPNAQPAASEEILALQRQDLERIQKRTEEARILQRGEKDIVGVQSPAKDDPSTPQ